MDFAARCNGCSGRRWGCDWMCSRRKPNEQYCCDRTAPRCTDISTDQTRFVLICNSEPHVWQWFVQALPKPLSLSSWTCSCSSWESRSADLWVTPDSFWLAAAFALVLRSGHRVSAFWCPPWRRIWLAAAFANKAAEAACRRLKYVARSKKLITNYALN